MGACFCEIFNLLRGTIDIQWNIGAQLRREMQGWRVYSKVFSLHVILHEALNKNKSNKARNKQTTKDKNKQINIKVCQFYHS